MYPVGRLTEVEMYEKEFQNDNAFALLCLRILTVAPRICKGVNRFLLPCIYENFIFISLDSILVVFGTTVRAHHLYV